MSLVRLLFDPREHRRRGRLSRMYGTYKTYLPQHALLNVGFMTILRRTDCFVLIRACGAVLTEPHNCHFQIVPASKRNPHKNKNAVLSCCHVGLENSAVKLHGRSHPAHNAARMVYHTDHKPFGVSRDKRVKGFITRSWSHRS